jgi:hypothetical protein
LNADDYKWVRRTWALALMVAALFVVQAAWKTDGKPFLPLDDAFIYLRYAQRLASGHWYSYSESSGFSTGSTSPLYPWLLAPVFWTGLHGTKTVPASLVWGLVFWLASLALIYELTKRLSHCLAGAIAAPMLCASGYCVYFFLSGMETGLHAWALLGAAVMAGRFEARPSPKTLAPLAFLIAILPLTRPEGMFASVLLAGWIVARRHDFFSEGAAEKKDSPGVRPRALWLTLGAAALPFAAWEASVFALTGSLQTNGLALKGLMANPTATLGEKAAFAANALGHLVSDFYSNKFDYYHMREARALAHPPFLLPVALLGLLATAHLRGERLRRPGLALLTLGLILVQAGSVAASEVFKGHNYRYLAPAEPLLLAAYVAGLWRLCEATVRLWPGPELAGREKALLEAAPLPGGYPAPGTPDWRRDRLFILAGGTMALVLATSLPWWADFYADNAADIYNQHRRMAWAWKPRLGPNDMIGISDAGVLPFYTEAEAFDYAGLVTNGMALPIRHGRGSAWEAVEKLPAERLPDWNILHPEALTAPDGRHWLGAYIDESSLARNRVTLGSRLMAFRPLWKENPGIVRSGDQPSAASLPEGARVMDALDVADLDSEAERHYRFDHGAEPPGPVFELYDERNVFLVEPNLVDGGRAIGGGERWQSRAELQPGGRYRLAARVSRPWPYLPPSAPEIRAKITLNGREIALGTLALDPSWPLNEFREVFFDFEVPPNAAPGQPEIEMTSGGSLFVPSVYVVYHYFLLEIEEN